MKRDRWLRVAGLIAVAGCLCGCGRLTRTRGAPYLAMGTQGEVRVGQAESRRVAEYGGWCRDLTLQIEAELSLFSPTSEVARLNAMSGVAPVPVGRHLAEVLTLARHYGDLSGGAFDVTVGPLMRLWGLYGGSAPATVPPAGHIEDARARTGYQRVRLTPTGAFLPDPGMEVDLGGIAKGYAVDCCCDELRRRGARDFMVNLGGNLRCYGQPVRGRAWRIGVRHPFRPDAILGTLELGDGMAVATSGNYERFVTIGGKRYAHILDPRTGMPVEGMAGVTAVCRSAVEADALSTALFVLGTEAGQRVLARVDGAEAIFVPDRQPVEIHVTPGLRDRFVPLREFAGQVRVLSVR
jgi:thiamine biosynthesis lipoprotein